MSLLGKILAILNVLAAAGFVVIAGMDYSQRHRWAYSVYRHQLLADGLPLDDNEKDADGAPRVRAFDEPWFNEMFQRAGGNPVKTQQAEVQSLQRQIQARIDSPEGNKTQKLARYVNALAQTYPQRKAVMRQMGEAGARQDDLSADLSAAYAHILDPKGMTQKGRDIVKSIREKATDPTPKPGEIAARVPFGKQPDDKTLIELQFGREPVILAVAPDGQFVPLREGAEVFITVATPTATKLQTILDSEFAAANKGSIGERKSAAARLMFNLGEAMVEEPTADYFSSPAHQRLLVVAGLSGAARAIDDQATTYRRMIQEVLSDDYQGGAIGDHEFDLRQFVGDHDQIVANNIRLADATEELERMLKDKEADLARQLLLVQKRQTEIDALRNRLDKDLKVQTKDKLAEQAQAEQEVRDRLIELRDTGRINQQLEREIRKLEGGPMR